MVCLHWQCKTVHSNKVIYRLAYDLDAHNEILLAHGIGIQNRLFDENSYKRRVLQNKFVSLTDSSEEWDELADMFSAIVASFSIP